MKLLTVLGTRPEIIRLSRIIHKLDEACEHVLVHTGQSFDDNMSAVFFKELALREPNYYLGVKSTTFAEQVGKVFTGVEDVITKEKPDRFLCLGDTNSALAAFIAKRMGVKVYHLEAGNRCYDDRVPEEVNRRVIDHSSDIHMPYTERSWANLLREGIAGEKIFVVGNPIYEVLNNLPQLPNTIEELDIASGEYFLVTAHRQENVDDEGRLRKLMSSLLCIWEDCRLPIIFSRHPRTAKRMEDWYEESPITFHEPFGLLDFVTLERNAKCVLTDSGTVQEECCLFRVRCVTLRDTTERPETIECGSNILSGVEPENVLRCVKVVLSQKTDWNPPPEYTRTDVSDTVAKVVTGY